MMTKQANVGDTLKLLAKNIKERRAELAITQEQLAELAGISHNYVARIELGLKQPSIATLTALATALDVELADLFARRRRPRQRATRTHYVDAALSGLTDDDRSLVMSVLTALVRRLGMDS